MNHYISTFFSLEKTENTSSFIKTMCTPIFSVHITLCMCMCTRVHACVLSHMAPKLYSVHNRQVLYSKHKNPTIIHSRVRGALIRLNWLLQHMSTLYMCICSSVHMCVWAHVRMWSQASTLGIFLGCTLPYVFNKPGTHQFGNTSWQVSSRGPPHSSPLVLASQGSWNLTTGPHAYIVHTAPNELSSQPSTLQYLKGFLCFYFYILNQHWL